MKQKVKIYRAWNEDDFRELGGLFKEYQEYLGINLDFQGFEKELADLKKHYGPPGGAALLATLNHQAVGCAAVRPFSPGISEMKRLYVRPASRGLGVGKALAVKIIDEATGLGYDAMRLDTIGTMKEAISLYKSLGFYTIKPYRENPLDDPMFMEIRLR